MHGKKKNICDQEALLNSLILRDPINRKVWLGTDFNQNVIKVSDMNTLVDSL